MCGIAGMTAFFDNLCGSTDVFRKMQETMSRRGPDQEGILITKHCALIHTRLSVIDVTGGLQPMQFSVRGETYTIVYNGELYNTPEIRQELLGRGYSFDGHSDTEVLLKAYVEFGEEVLDMCNGIFAFAVWEHRRERLFMARDRMGVKPLFYYLSPDILIFGSELKTILSHPAVPHEMDIKGIAEILLMGPGRTPGCGVFRGISELMPAHFAYYTQEDGFVQKCYWELAAQEHHENFSQTAEHVRFLVTDAIKRQLVSDVPIGTFLSGGLDSSLISSVAAREMGGALHTFSVDYRDNDKYFQKSKFQPNSDPAFIRQMQEYLGVHHHWTVIDTPALCEALYLAVDARDLPGMADVDASLLLFCQDIREHVTVALSGECADELFGGYPWYRDPEIRSAYGFPWSQSTAYRMSFAKEDIAARLEELGYVDAAYNRTVAAADHLPDDPPLEKRMREMMRMNLQWFMQTLLDRKDRMSMYSSLEVRVPFCDYRIAQYLYNVPWEFKEHGGYEKGLLREAMRGYLPDEILWRKKSPYPKTHNPAYLQAVISMMQERLRNPSAPILQLVRREALEELMYGDKNVQWYGQLMTKPQTIAYLVQLDYWMEKYKVKLVL